MGYPAFIESDHPDVYAERVDDHYRVHFPFTRATTELVKSILMRPEFDKTDKVWFTPAEAYELLPGQLKTIADKVESETQALVELEKEGKEAVKSIKTYDNGADLYIEPLEMGADDMFFRNNHAISRERIVVKTAYHRSIVNLFRNFWGEFDNANKTWRFPLRMGNKIARYWDRINEWHADQMQIIKEREQRRNRQQDAQSCIDSDSENQAGNR